MSTGMSTAPSEGSQTGPAPHAHDYSPIGACVVAGCDRRRPTWLDPSDVPVPDEERTDGGPDWGQRIALIALSLVVTFGGLHYVAEYVTKVTEQPTTTNGYLDLPDETGAPVPLP